MTRKTALAAALLLAAACGGPGGDRAAGGAKGTDGTMTAKTGMPRVGDVAPDFTLPDQDRTPVTLSDFRGRSNVVLAFYILAFTGG